MNLETVIAHALLSSLEKRAQSQGGLVARIDPPFLPARGTPTMLSGYFHLQDVSADIAAAVLAVSENKQALVK